MKNKHIIIGVTGGIAAYKTAFLVRELIRRGAEVRVLMTQAAKNFITPLTMATLSKNPVFIEFFYPENGSWNSHVDLGLWADAIVVAPATANTIAKMANGIADNLLTTTILSAKCPIFIAPAMDLDMMNHEATQSNLKTLQSRGVTIIDPEDGELASGLTGKGRMAEPTDIAELLENFWAEKTILKDKQILVTAGPTQEKIDPVRFISNYSSGKMGFAIAEELARRGAIVHLVAGPVNLKVKSKNIHRIDVQTAQEMFDAASEIFPQCQCAILSAAVADFTPEKTETNKIKCKTNLTLQLVPTLDIAENLGKIKQKNQLLIGFALETNNEFDNAAVKLQKKNLDFIVLNSLNDPGAGFMHDTNKVTIIQADGRKTPFELKSKAEVATDIVNFAEKYF